MGAFAYNNLSDLKKITDNYSSQKRFPVLFIGHGTPMNALFDNNFTKALAQLGRQLERPKAILVISAHWETPGTFVSTNPSPKTIYDFGGFDRALYEIKYEPKGAPELAHEVVTLVKSTKVQEDVTMGLDHGAWTVLHHIFPQADVPVFQMSLDYTKSPEQHYQIAQEIKALRNKGVLIVGSGNVVHNLRLLDWSSIDAKPTDWTLEFDELVKTNINSGNFEKLVKYQDLGTIAKLSIPTSDHYLPMLYTLGAADKNEPVKYLYEGYQYGTLSMRCFQIG